MCSCVPATVGDVVVFAGQPSIPEAWLGEYSYVPKEGESFEQDRLPQLILARSKVVLEADSESYGGVCVSSRVPGAELYVIAFPEFFVRSGTRADTFERVFFIVRKVNSKLYVWDLLAETLGPAPWHVDKVKKFLQKNPNIFDINKPGLVFRKKA